MTVAPIVLWLPDPLGQRLLLVLRDAGYVVTRVPDAAACAAAVTPETIFLAAATGPVLQAESAWQAARARALLIGRQDPAAFARWQAAGVTLLAGSLPGVVLDWLASLQGGTTDPLDLEWRDAPRGAAAPAGPRLLAVASAAGGVGKTTTATIFARLAAEDGGRVVLVEADEDKSGVCRLFGFDPGPPGLDTIPAILWEDPGALTQELPSIARPVPQRRGTLTLYPMVGTAEGLPVKDETQWLACLHAVGQGQDWVIVDLPPRFRDLVAYATVEHAAWTVLVYEPTEIALDAALKHVELARQLGLDPTRFRLLLNRVTPDGLDPRAFARHLEGIPLLGTIPEDGPRYRAYVNHGRLHLPPTDPWRTVWAALTGRPAAAAETAPAPAPAARPALWRRILGLRS